MVASKDVGRHSESLRQLRRVAPLLALAGLALVIAGQRLHTYREPLGPEITTPAVVARELRAGRWLYSDLWDHGPPAIHVAHVVSQSVAGDGRGSVFFLGMVCALLTLASVYVAGSGAAGVAGGLWAAAFWTAVSSDVWMEANQPAGATLVSAGSAVVLAGLILLKAGERSRSTVIGLVIALISLVRPLAAFGAALGVGVHFLCAPPGRRRQAIGDVFRMGLAVGVIWAALAIYMALTGRLEIFGQAAFVYPRLYEGSGAETVRYVTQRWFSLPSTVHAAIPMAVIAAIGTAVAGWRRDRRVWLLIIGFVAGAWVSAIAARFPSSRDFQVILPPLAIGAGVAIAHAASTWTGEWRRVPHLAGALALGLIVIYELPIFGFSASEWSRIKGGEGNVASEAVGREVAALLRPGESAFQWGNETGVYFAGPLRPPTGVLALSYSQAGPLVSALRRRSAQELAQWPPEVIVMSKWAMFGPDVRDPVLDWIRPRYVPLPGDPERGPFVLFILRGGRLEREHRAAVPPRTP